jgi:hypothetical protein
MNRKFLFACLGMAFCVFAAHAQSVNGYSVSCVFTRTQQAQGLFLKVAPAVGSANALWVFSMSGVQGTLAADEVGRNSQLVYLRLRSNGTEYALDTQGQKVFVKGTTDQSFRDIGMDIVNALAGPELPSPGQDYQIVAAHSNKPLCLPQGWPQIGAEAFQSRPFDCYARFQFILDEGSGTFSIVRSDHQNVCLEVAGASNADGAPIIEGTLANSPNQKFMLLPVDGTHFRIATFCAKVIDVYGGPTATADHTRITQWTTNGGTNQQFMIEKISEDSGVTFRRMN